MATKTRPPSGAKLKSSAPHHAAFGAQLRGTTHSSHAVGSPRTEATRTHFNVHSPQISRKVTTFVNRRRNK